MSFPTTPILDSGVGADQNPIAGNWTSPEWSEQAMERLSNQFTSTSGAAFAAMAWTASSFGPDCEAYFTIPTMGSEFFLHIKVNVLGASASTLDDYVLLVNTGSTNNIQIFKNVNNAGTTLATYSQLISNGDSVGIQAVGSTIGAWYKSGAGAWTQLGTVTDSTYASQSGHIALESQNNSSKFTNFGGGTFVPPAVGGPHNLTLLGVGN